MHALLGEGNPRDTAGAGAGAGRKGTQTQRAPALWSRGRQWRAPQQREAAWRVACAEAAGAALLVLLSCAPSCATPPLEPLQRALAAGAVVALLVQCLDHISGAQMNPTVTLAAVLWGRFTWRRALCMLTAQLAGACAGVALLVLVLPEGAPGGCLTLPAAGLAPWRALLLEGTLSGCLALANCACWDPRNAHMADSWPLRIGSCVAAMSLVSGPLTGASMNPARSLAPALFAGHWHHHWVYWAGPLAGSLLCTSFYCIAWRPTLPRAPAPPGPRPRPLPMWPDPDPCARPCVIVQQHRTI